MKDFDIETKLSKLRKKWKEAKKRGDWAMCKVIERQAKILKQKKIDILEEAKKIFKK